MKAGGHKSLNYLLSGLFCVVLPLVPLDAESQTALQEAVDLLGATPPGTGKAGLLPYKAEGLNISPKIAQKFYERTIAGSPYREGKLDWNLLMQLIKDKPSGPIALKLLEGVVIEFTPEKYKSLNGKPSASGQKHRWSGRVTQKSKVVGEGLFIIDENAQRLTATIQYNDKLYEIVSLKNGNVRILEIKADRFPDEHPTQLNDGEHTMPAQPPTDSAQLECDAPPYLIDLLILYTEDAQKTWGAKEIGDISMEFTKAIEITNKAFENSHIKAEVRIVDTRLVPSSDQFTESSTLDIDLGKLQDPAFLGETVATWRNKAGADLVSLWVSGGDWCGASPYFINRGPRQGGEDGFSVVVADCATNQFSLAHEIGHNLGARHTRFDEGVTPGDHAYNFGHLSVPDGVRTIEAENDQCKAAGKYCRRVLHYSNPDIPFPDLATKTGIGIGTAGAADNHTQLNATVCEAAAYRSPPE